MIYLFSRINRYICRVFLKWYGICALGLFSIILLFETIEMFRRLMSRPNIPFGVTLEVLLLKTPAHLELLMPLIALGAGMLTLWRLNQSSEITVIRASGISIWKISFGLGVIAGLLGVLYITVLNPIQTTFTRRVYFLEDRYFGTRHNALTINPTGIWLRDVYQDNQMIFHAEHMDPQDHSFHKVSLFLFDDESRYIRRYNAQDAFLESGHWRLESVEIYKDEGSESVGHRYVPTHITLERIQNNQTDPETLSFWELPDHIESLKRAGLTPLTYQISYENHFAMVGIMIVMVLLATIFSIRPIRFGRANFFITSGLGLGLVFHFLGDFSYALGLGGRLPSLIAVFAPVVFGLLLSLFLLIHVEDGKRT